MIDHMIGVMKCKQLHRIDIFAKFDKKLMSAASKFFPADLLKHPFVADYIAWRFIQLRN